MFNYRKIEDQDVELEYIAVASVDELSDGERLLLDVGDLPLAVFRIAGEYFAIADLCSHDDGPVAEGERRDLTIECPRHGATFDLRNGKALSLPAVVDIPAYPVQIENGQILVGLPVDRAA
jgi:3-phenylpropionate/trans-cinnamate dioxygenase ferredoxin component